MMLDSITQKSGMKKQLRNRISSLIKLISINPVKPISEKPPINAQSPGAPPANHATELFERFTAEIVRERVVLTR
jgi:hypothetical protein